ncbi:ABC transporter ATP-binding protein [Candidatus Saccharibacteria bacterium]|nr:ABC transporter ATP-binding protein [Candidatus Saccharibacteria bacterium]
MSNIAISLKLVNKIFKLPHERRDTLKSAFVNIFKAKTSYEEYHVLKDISLEIKKGEFVGVVGRNGSGKSTLLKILSEIYKPTSGDVKINGSLTSFIELGIGFNPELTGRENVYLNGVILGLTKKGVEEKYDEIVAFAELEKFMDQKLKNYSSGMQVRLAFSIAIQAHNDILLVDEVLAVGDADFQKKCATVFKQIKNSDKTVVFVSHDMSAVKEYCDKAILIEDGKIISSGDPEKVANDYTQLFNKEAVEASKEEGRWGDMQAVISNVSAKVNKDIIDVKYKFTAKKKEIKDPIMGLIIRDASNNHLFDTNTKWKKISTGTLKKGEAIELHLTMPNIFQAGQYSISVAAAHEDGYNFYDWQDRAVTFDVTRNQATAGMLVLDTDLKLRKITRDKPV